LSSSSGSSRGAQSASALHEIAEVLLVLLHGNAAVPSRDSRGGGRKWFGHDDRDVARQGGKEVDELGCHVAYAATHCQETVAHTL